MEGSAISGTAGRRAWLAPATDAVLTLGVFVAWELRFGRLGPEFNSDIAVQGAMLLRPIDKYFIYFWGQSRLGSLVPALGKLLGLIVGLSAAEATQLAVYLCSAVGLWLMLGPIRSVPGKALLTVFCAFPSLTMTRILLCPGGVLPGLLFFGAWQVRLFLRFVREPTRGGALWLGLASSGLLWAGEPGLFLIVSEAAALASTRARRWLLQCGWILVGAIPFTIVIAVGKRTATSLERREIFRLQELSIAIESVRHLGRSLAPLWPLLGAITYPLIVLLGIAGVAALVRGARRGALPTAFAVLAPVPLLATWGTAVNEWYFLNQRAPRYFTFPLVLAVWVCALALDRLLDRLSNSSLRWATAPAAAAMLWMAIVDSRGNGLWLPTISNWQATVQWAERSGCQGVIGDYWHSYPFFTLSEGRMLATPHEGDSVRNQALADETARVPLLCVVPWWDGACKPELEQFGVRRVWRDEVDGNPSGEPMRLCRYEPP